MMDGMDDTSPAHPGMDSLEKQQAPTVEHVDSGGSVPDLFEAGQVPSTSPTRIFVGSS